MRKNIKSQNWQIEKMASQLRMLHVDFPDDATKQRMKTHLMSKISRDLHAEQLESKSWDFSTHLQAVSRGIILPPHVKARMKERLFAIIEASLPQQWTFFAFARRMVSGVLVTSLVMTLFLSIQDPIPVSMAQSGTFVTDLTGTVTVYRDGQSLLVTDGFVLEQGDILATGARGHATIRYFDHSVTRLDQNTQLLLDVLQSSVSSDPSLIEVDLQSGHMWSRVLSSLNSDYRFTVRVGKLKAQAQKKAAFDLETLPNGTLQMQVYNNIVDLVAEDSGEKVVRPILKGYKAVMLSEASSTAMVSASSLRETESNEWVAQNLQQDEHYIGKLAEDSQKARNESVSVLPSNALLYPVKTFTENATLLLTFDDLEKDRVKLNFAKRRFLEATVLIEQNKLDSASAAMQSYQETLQSVADRVQFLDSEKAQQLQSELNAVIQGSKKDLQMVSADQPLYSVKQVVLKTEIAVAQNNVERQRLLLQNRTEDLLDVQDLAFSGKTELAEEKLKEFQKTSQDALTQAKDFQESDLTQALQNVLSQQKDAVKMLTVLEKDVQLSQISTTVTELKEESLSNLQQTVSQVPAVTGDDSVKQIVQEVRDVTKTYDSPPTAVAVTTTIQVESSLQQPPVSSAPAVTTAEPIPETVPEEVNPRVLPPKFQLKDATTTSNSELK